jgi:hypothetical protein
MSADEGIRRNLEVVGIDGKKRREQGKEEDEGSGRFRKWERSGDQETARTSEARRRGGQGGEKLGQYQTSKRRKEQADQMCRSSSSKRQLCVLQNYSVSVWMDEWSEQDPLGGWPIMPSTWSTKGSKQVGQLDRECLFA